MGIKLRDIDGTTVKGFNLEYWGGLQGFLDATSNGSESGMATAQQLRQVVPWLAKATDMTANAVASLPFDITNESGDIVDSSDDWKNKAGGLEIPSQIFAKLASSLCLGKAYLIPRYTSKYIVDLQYVAPHTIKLEKDKTGIKWFDRATDEGTFTRYYPMGENKPEIMYFWLPDSDVEIGPALSYPAGAALLSARLLFSMDGTIQTYSERGFVPATLLAVKGNPNQGEKEKTEAWWNRWLRGWTKEAAKIINIEAMDVKQIGAGMEQLKGAYAELTKQAIENVGTAYGIPAALFMSDMAYASEANAMIKVWYETSAFVKIYSTIENTFNQQLFGRYGLKMSFHPETLDVFAEDEMKGASAFKMYIDAGLLPSVASKLVGLELPDGVTPEMLDAQVERKQKMEEEAARVNAEAQMAKLQAGKEVEDKQEKLEEKPKEVEKKPLEPEDDEEKSIHLTAAQIKELNLWRQIAERNDRKGKGRALDFECKHLPEDVQMDIRAKLASKADVARAFEITNTPVERGYDDVGLKALADAINNAMSVPEVKAQPTSYTFNIPSPTIEQPSITVQIPEQQPPNITVTPEVKVINEVNPTPVTIENTVNVPEEKHEPETIEVIRDQQGNVKKMVKK